MKYILFHNIEEQWIVIVHESELNDFVLEMKEYGIHMYDEEQWDHKEIEGPIRITSNQPKLEFNW